MALSKKQSTGYRNIMHKQPEYNSGFTLIELLITITIAAIVLGIAIPSFSSTIASNRLTTSANELVTALNFARSEAVKRGMQVTVRNKGAATQWESGWDVFVDFNGNGNLDDTNSIPCETNADGSLKEDCLLRTYDALPSSYTLRTGNNLTCWLAYTSTGLGKGSGSDCTGGLSNDTFTLCFGSGVTVPRRTITINATGRPRVDAAPGACP
jgi:type IV fimbrial biogenesis protein FimT